MHTLLDLRSTWENSTQVERKDLVHGLLQKVGVDVAARRILWVKVRPDYEPLVAFLDGLHKDGDLRYWIEPLEAQVAVRDGEAFTRQISTGVKTMLRVSHNALSRIEEYLQ